MKNENFLILGILFMVLIMTPTTSAKYLIMPDHPLAFINGFVEWIEYNFAANKAIITEKHLGNRIDEIEYLDAKNDEEGMIPKIEDYRLKLRTIERVNPYIKNDVAIQKIEKKIQLFNEKASIWWNTRDKEFEVLKNFYVYYDINEVVNIKITSFGDVVYEKIVEVVNHTIIMPSDKNATVWIEVEHKTGKALMTQFQSGGMITWQQLVNFWRQGKIRVIPESKILEYLI